MQDRPTAVEFLDALRDFMRDRAENARDRWERFQFQVAANSIDILRREAELEDGFMRQEWSGLDRLLGPEEVPDAQAALTVRLRERNEELVRLIQAGHYDEGAEEGRLLPHIWETVTNKVRVANPKELR